MLRAPKENNRFSEEDYIRDEQNKQKMSLLVCLSRSVPFKLLGKGWGDDSAINFLAEDLGSGPSTHVRASQLPVPPSPRERLASAGSALTSTHLLTVHTHTHTIFKNKQVR